MSYPLDIRLDNGAKASDWLGTAMTAAKVAATLIERVRTQGGTDGDLVRATEELQQALEEVAAVRARVGAYVTS